MKLGLDKNKHLEQTPWENMVDMLFGNFDSSGLTKSELQQICCDCFQLADCSYSYMRIAEFLITELSEFSFARNTYKIAEMMSDEASDYKYLADSVIDNLGDLVLGLRLLEKAICMTNEKPKVWDYILIAETYSETIGDNIRARDFYELAEKHSIFVSDFNNVAKSVLENLHDENWFTVLMEKAYQNLHKVEDANTCCYEYIGIADKFCEHLGDSVRGREIYRLAMNYAITFDEFESIANSVKENLHDEVWYEGLIRKGFQSADSTPTCKVYSRLAVAYCKYKHDVIRARELFELAEKCSLTSVSIQYLAFHIQEHLHDEVWYEDLMRKASLLTDSLSKN